MPTVRDLLERYEQELEELGGRDPPMAMTRACDHLLAEMEDAEGGDVRGE